MYMKQVTYVHEIYHELSLNLRQYYDVISMGSEEEIINSVRKD